MLITRETKLEIVRKHLEDGKAFKELSEEYCMHPSNVQYYANLYRRHLSVAADLGYHAALST